ncbi:MAG: type II/IV secretion system ATPase subunit [Candidatus Parvarchaeota archaeon]
MDTENPAEELDVEIQGVKVSSLRNISKEFEGGKIYEIKKLKLYGTDVLVANGIDADSQLIYRIVEPEIDEDTRKIINFITKERSLLLMDIDNTSGTEKHVEDKIMEFLTQHYGEVDNALLWKVFYYMKKEFIGAGDIDVLFADPRIEDISLSGEGQAVYVMLPGSDLSKEGYYATDIRPVGPSYEKLLLRVGQIADLIPSYLTPILDGTIRKNQNRVNLIYGNQVSPFGGAFTIRSVKETPLTFADLIVGKEINVEMAAWLWFLVEKGASILIFGSTGSGKTTLLNALLFFVPRGRKIVVIEDTRELRLTAGSNWMVGITRKPSTLEQTFRVITLHDQLVSALRMRPDYITVGEIRGSEAYTLFDAMSSGHTGLGTVHAGSLQDLMNRFAGGMNKEGGMYVPPALQNSVDVLIHISQVILPETGTFQRRRVLNIWENKPVELRTKGVGISEIYPEFVRDRSGNGLFSYDAVTDTFTGLSSELLEGYLADYYGRRDGMSHEEVLKDLNRRATVINYVVAERSKLNPFQIQLILNYYTTTKKLKDEWKKYAVNLPYSGGI